MRILRAPFVAFVESGCQRTTTRGKGVGKTRKSYEALIRWGADRLDESNDD